MSELKKGDKCYFLDNPNQPLYEAHTGFYDSAAEGIFFEYRGAFSPPRSWLDCQKIPEDDTGITLAAFIGGLEEDIEFLKQKIDAKEHLLSMIREQISDDKA